MKSYDAGNVSAIELKNLHNALILASLVVSLVSFSVAGGELPSISEQSANGGSLIPPFKMDCHTRTEKNQALGGRFSMQAKSDTNDEHAHHRTMMQNKKYKLLSVGYTVPDVELISQRGERRSLQELLDTDKPIILNFIFTTCTTICPVLSAGFHQVQEILGSESKSVSMISITIDPDYDTPEQLMKYAKRFKAGDQWQFYTGTYNDIVMVEKAFDIFRGSKMNHDPITLIRKQDRQNWVRIDGVASAEDIVKEYRKTIAANN